MQVSSQLFPHLSVVIPVHNAQETIGQCLDSLLASDISSYSYEIIVVNNGSTDQSSEILSTYDVKVITVPWCSRSRARNVGIHEAQSEWIVFLDADVTVAPDWFSLAFAGLKDFPMVGGGQGIIQPYFHNDEKWAPGKNILAFPISSPSIDTAACLYRRQALLDVGGFDESLIRCQDIDLSRRVALAGWILKTNKSHAFCREKRIRISPALFRYYAELSNAECLFNRKWKQKLLPPPKILNPQRSVLAGLIFYLIWHLCQLRQFLCPTSASFKYGPTFPTKKLGKWTINRSKLIVITDDSVIISAPDEKHITIIEGILRLNFLDGLHDLESEISESHRLTIETVLS